MTWDAERIEGCQLNGRTRPLLMDCVSLGPDGEVDEHRTMLAKVIGLPEVTETSLFAEYFGSQLAIQFGIDAPSPALVDVSDDLLKSSAERLAGWGINPKAGVAVGLEERRGIAPLSRFAVVKDGSMAEAALIYAFDLLAQNPDRRDVNPNCGTVHGRLVAFDFEMAFSFLYPVIGGAEPWRVSALPFAKTHLFWRSLREGTSRGLVAWEGATAAVEKIDAEIDQLVGFLPDKWRALGEKVGSHVHSIRSEIGEFRDELQRSLE